MIRIAVVGCGAIAESFHLPALEALGKDEVSVVLVDPDRSRARELGRRFGLTETALSHREVAGELDGAVLCTPHHLHVPIASELVQAGVGVLSEKPLGTSVAEVEALRDLSESTGIPVAVNQTRRFIPACREIRRLLQAGELGRVESVEMAEGDRFGWPAATPSMFGAAAEGKGVLLDIGVHALDLATWWLGSELSLESHNDDSFGGSEAAVRSRFRFGGATLSLRLSWLAKQPNRYMIRGEDGVITWNVYDLDRIEISRGPARGPGDRMRVHRIPGAPASFADLAPEVIGDFLDSLRTGSRPAVSAEDVLPAMRLIEACYARRERMAMPWHDFTLDPSHVS